MLQSVSGLGLDYHLTQARQEKGRKKCHEQLPRWQGGIHEHVSHIVSEMYSETADHHICCIYLTYIHKVMHKQLGHIQQFLLDSP